LADGIQITARDSFTNARAADRSAIEETAARPCTANLSSVPTFQKLDIPAPLCPKTKFAPTHRELMVD